MGPDLALSPVTGLNLWAYLQLAPPTLTPTAMHLWWDSKVTLVHTDTQGPHSCQCAHSWIWPFLLALLSTTTCVFVISHRHYTDFFQIAPAVKCLHTTGSDHHHWLPWSLAAGTEGTTEHPESTCDLCRTSAVLTKGHIVVDAVELSGLSQRDIIPPGLGATIHPHVDALHHIWGYSIL